MRDDRWLFVVLALFAAAGVAMVVTTRGIRNNNPGNLIDVGIPWVGLVGHDAQGYCIFDTLENGIRAATKDLLTGFRRDAEDTVAKILAEYAPPPENDTQAYIRAVTNELFPGQDWRALQNAVLTADQDTLRRLDDAIFFHENGVRIDTAAIAEGVRRAFVS